MKELSRRIGLPQEDPCLQFMIPRALEGQGNYQMDNGGIYQTVVQGSPGETKHIRPCAKE